MVAASSTRSESPCVLLVDDDEGAVETHAIYLENGGFDTAIETDPERVLGRLDEADCIVSDYQMPEMDGLELLHAVRERDEQLPFILFTGRGSEEIASEAISAGVTDYLQKGGPEKYDLLANRVRNAIERAAAQYELERTRARFEALTENTGFVVITIDESSTIEFAGGAVESMLGYEAEALMGEPLAHIIPDEFVSDHYEAIARYVETGERNLDWEWVELPAEHSDGAELQVGVSFGERTTDQGDRLFTGVIRDITDEVARRRQLEQERDRFRALFENAHDAIAIVDPETETVVDANEAYLDLMGYDQTDLGAFTVRDIHPDNYDDISDFLDAVHEAGEVTETACTTRDGRTIEASVSGAAFEHDGRERLVTIVRPKDPSLL